jgi:long-subunit fatty acid transport protein
MKLKQSIFLSATCLSLLVTTQTYAQTIDDALIFSQENNGTSARIRGLGDAQTALGGDISAINGNPAGLGFFGRSDISATFNYLQNNTSTDYEVKRVISV